ncbi:hypothetical protein B4064_0657 [Caldibacillus thermoamylovorans]|nr:hypothetical protein B4065_0709 [Caldibacillus thermoamylovorans]KIO67397.1 hypothetical protein B4064_0657 [Caldibacillus thermoamylovorans]
MVREIKRMKEKCTRKATKRFIGIEKPGYFFVELCSSLT